MRRLGGGQCHVHPSLKTAQRSGRWVVGWQGNNRRRRGRGSSQTWLIHHTWACFLYQNIFKGLKKKEQGKTDLDRVKKGRFSEARSNLPLGMFSVSVNARVGVVHAVCERPWVQLSVLSMFIVLLCYHNYE